MNQQPTESRRDFWITVALSILAPPIAVYRQQHGMTDGVWICIVLTLFFILPGTVVRRDLLGKLP